MGMVSVLGFVAHEVGFVVSHIGHLLAGSTALKTDVRPESELGSLRITCPIHTHVL